MTTHLKLSFASASPPQWIRFIEEYPEQGNDTATPSNTPLTMNPLRYRLMCAVHRDINTVCRYKHDEVGNDHWKLIHDFPYEGDCEDFALTKRAMLIEAGFPYGCLWPTVCKKYGKGHMVLIVDTDLYSYVLDIGNNIPITSVGKVPYKWISAFDGYSWRLAYTPKL